MVAGVAAAAHQMALGFDHRSLVPEGQGEVVLGWDDMVQEPRTLVGKVADIQLGQVVEALKGAFVA